MELHTKIYVLSYILYKLIKQLYDKYMVVGNLISLMLIFHFFIYFWIYLSISFEYSKKYNNILIVDESIKERG